MGMGIYHVFIPYQFSWKDFLHESIPTINWSLFTINNYLSFLLVVIGLSLGYLLIFRPKQIVAIKLLSWNCLAFWLFSFIYQIVSPIPVPTKLNWIPALLTAIAFMNALLFLLPLITNYKKSNSL